MKFSVEWLKDHLDTDADVARIAATLNAIGHEVEGIEDPAERLAGFRVAKVLTAARHPDADKLQVLTVDTRGFVVMKAVGHAFFVEPGARFFHGVTGFDAVQDVSH